ncbi:SpoIIE family protein phosphatase [bacterium]|nr:SpoIIE family protein phosphatase [bacterium]
MKLNLKSQLILFSLILILISGALLGGITFFMNRTLVEKTQQKERQIQIQDNLGKLNVLSSEFNRFENWALELYDKMKDNKKVIEFEAQKVLRQYYAFNEFNFESGTLYDLFKEFHSRHEDQVDFLLWLDEYDRILMSYPISLTGVFTSDKIKDIDGGLKVFNFNMQSRDPEIDGTEGYPVLYSFQGIYPTPLTNEFKNSKLLLQIRMDTLLQDIAEALPSENEAEAPSLFLTDNNDLAVYHTNANELFKMIPQQKTDQVWFRETVPIKNMGWNITLWRKLSQDFSSLTNEMSNQFNQGLLIGIAISIAIAVVLGLVIALRFVRELLQLTEGAEIIADGNYDYQVTTKRRDEIGDLARSFNIMNSRLKGAFEKIETENKRLEGEIKEAHDLQMNLLPQQTPVLPGIQLSGMLSPAMEVGGDYFDYIVHDENLHIVIADSSGKGFSGAFSIALTRGVFRTYMKTQQTDTISNILSSVELGVSQQHIKENVTMGLARINIQTRKIEFTNAGHPIPILYDSRSGNCKRLKVTGHVMNSLLEPENRPRNYTEIECQLNEGDIVTFFSDGLVEESFKGERFGYERLERAIKINKDQSADGVKDGVYKALTDFCGKKSSFSDDVTLVVLKVSAK